MKRLRQKREEQTGIASEIEKNKLVTVSHKCLTSYVTRLHNSTCFCALYAHTYLTLLIYIAGDFVHFTSVSDTV